MLAIWAAFIWVGVSLRALVILVRAHRLSGELQCWGRVPMECETTVLVLVLTDMVLIMRVVRTASILVMNTLWRRWRRIS